LLLRLYGKARYPLQYQAIFGFCGLSRFCGFALRFGIFITIGAILKGLNENKI